MGVKMPNAQFSNESVSRYLKSGYTIQAENDEVVILVKRRKVGIFWNLVLTLLTGGFWLLVWIPRLIFRSSVVRLYKSEIPTKQTGLLLDMAEKVAAKFKGSSPEGKLIAAGALVALLAISLISGNMSPDSEANLAEKNAYTTHQDQLETGIEPSYCNDLKATIEGGAAVTFASKNLALATRSAKTLTVWNAGAYLLNSDWVSSAGKLLSDFEAEQEATTNRLLTTRVKALNDTSAVAGLKELDGIWGDRFRQFAVIDCGLAETVSSAEKQIYAVATAARAIQVKADSKPWYPKGFEETGFPGFAYKNISNQGCSYSFGSCAKFKIVSNTDCPSNLYVQTNHLVNGEVDDWSNDTATVMAGQVAVMETTFNSDNAGAWQFAKINCY